MKKIIFALTTFIGTIIGVGIFGLPFAVSKFGFFPSLLYFTFLGVVLIIYHLVIGEIALRTKGEHRMPGFAKIYLGPKGEAVAVISGIIGLFGTNLAYIIVGGNFLAQILMPVLGGTEFVYVLLYFISGAFIIFLGTAAIAKSELISVGVLFTILAILGWNTAPHIQAQNFLTVDWRYILLPYGVVLFALSGASIVPELKEILGSSVKKLKSVIIIGTIIPAIVSLLFVIFVLGVSGASTTEDAITGLRNIIGSRIIALGYIFGIVASFTSYLSVGETLKKVFWYDLKFSHFNAWIFASFIPILLYFAGLKNFIVIIALTGAVTTGIDLMITYLIHRKAKKTGLRKPEYEINLPISVWYCILSVFLAGVILSILFIH